MASVKHDMVAILCFISFGLSALSEGGRIPRIVDGVRAKDGELPFMVSIRRDESFLRDYQHLCGGAILNSHYIVTAAHCLFPNIDFATGIRYQEPNSVHEQVGYPMGHENYRLLRDESAVNDIALIKVTPPFKFDDTFYPVKLPAKDFKVSPGEKLIAAGWGATNVPAAGATFQLKKTTVTAISEDQCRKLNKNLVKVSAKQICTHEPAGERRGTCAGDSGGPLVTKDNVLVGITSWAISEPHGCGTHPSVYVRVTDYLDWIHQQMNRREEEDRLRAQPGYQMIEPLLDDEKPDPGSSDVDSQESVDESGLIIDDELSSLIGQVFNNPDANETK